VHRAAGREDLDGGQVDGLEVGHRRECRRG
jgi:hypothetical protein